MLARRPALLLFVVALFVYNLNLRPIPSGDSAATAILPFAVYLDGTIHLDRFAPWFEQAYNGNAYFLHKANGHVYSTYPIATALAITPLYAPVLLIPRLSEWRTEDLVLLARVLEKLVASFIAGFSVVVFFWIARRRLSVARAIVAACVFAFATETWSISGQALWQHGLSQLMILLSLFYIDRANAIGAALFAALSVAMRPTDLLFLLISGTIAVWSHREEWKKWCGTYAGFAILVGVPLAIYNLEIFGHLRGAYQQPFTGSFLPGLGGLLFSPARGLLFFTPVLFFVRPLREGALGLICLLFPLAHILLYAKWPMWWGGHAWGPRLLTDLMPCLTLLLIPAISALSGRRIILFAALAAISTGVQFLGAFSYPKGAWDAVPVDVDQHPERLWHWRANPIAAALDAGIYTEGYRIAAEVLDALWRHRRPKIEGIKIAHAEGPPEFAQRRAST